MRQIVIIQIVLILLSGKMSIYSLTSSDTANVTMVLWRGITEAEQGFMNGFKGQPVRFTMLDCEQDNNALLDIRNKLITNPPDLIYAFGTTVAVTLAGKHGNIKKFVNITQTPIIFSVVADPYGAGLVPKESVRSGRNISGVSHLIPIDVQVNVMNLITPVKSIGVIYNPAESNSQLQVNQIRDLTSTHMIKVHLFPLYVKADKTVMNSAFDSCISAIRKDRIDILYLPSDSYIISNASKIIDSCHNAHIPTFSATEQPIRNSNAFAGIVSKYYAAGSFAAFKAKQVLAGAHIDTIPIERTPKYSIVINMKACRKLDIYPPVTILRMAEIIE
jgi:putative tryptophan/tyrosine transport system substrate-binding protein